MTNKPVTIKTVWPDALALAHAAAHLIVAESNKAVAQKNIFTIADAKRGDIGNTSSMYARAFFEKEKSGFDFDALTVAPYMGEDSVKPFLDYKNKWVILLALTSNKGAQDFQFTNNLYQQVLETSKKWGNTVFAHIGGNGNGIKI